MVNPMDIPIKWLRYAKSRRLLVKNVPEYPWVSMDIHRFMLESILLMVESWQNA